MRSGEGEVSGATLPVSDVAGVELELVVIPQQALLDVTEVHRLPVDEQELHAALEGGGGTSALRGRATWVERRHGGGPPLGFDGWFERKVARSAGNGSGWIARKHFIYLVGCISCLVKMLLTCWFSGDVTLAKAPFEEAPRRPL